MKRFIAIILLVMFLLPAVALNVFAAEEDFAYIVQDDGTIAITKYNGDESNVVFPESINGLPVTTLGNGSSAIFGSNIYDVTLPAGLTQIADNAFENTDLSYIYIPEGVTSVGNKAFANCQYLTSVIVPNSLTFIGQDAFNTGKASYVENVNGSIMLPTYFDGERGTYAEQYAKENNIPYQIYDEEIYGSIMYVASHGATIKMWPNDNNPDTTFNIPAGTEFAVLGEMNDYYYVIDSLWQGTSLGYIEKAFFSSVAPSTEIAHNWQKTSNTEPFVCKTCGITSDFNYTINENGTATIHDYTGSAQSLTIPADFDGHVVVAIANDAFRACTSLSSISLPESIMSIGNSAFLGCTSLTSFTIPNNVTTIGDYAFEKCSSLTSITIPDSVTTIGERAFYNCDALASVTLSNNLASINNEVFSSCSNLTSITIPDSVTAIGDKAFWWCKNLTSVTLSNNLISIGDSAFVGCNLTSITFPDSLTNIGSCAFGNSYNIYPDSYKVYFSYNAFTSVVIPDSVTSIGDRAFSACPYLTSVIIPESVTSIGKNAFDACDNLSAIILSQGSNAEDYCKKYGLKYSYKSTDTLNPEAQQEEAQRQLAYLQFEAVNDYFWNENAEKVAQSIIENPALEWLNTTWSAINNFGDQSVETFHKLSNALQGVQTKEEVYILAWENLLIKTLQGYHNTALEIFAEKENNSEIVDILSEMAEEHLGLQVDKAGHFSEIWNKLAVDEWIKLRNAGNINKNQGLLLNQLFDGADKAWNNTLKLEKLGDVLECVGGFLTVMNSSSEFKEDQEALKQFANLLYDYEHNMDVLCAIGNSTSNSQLKQACENVANDLTDLLWNPVDFENQDKWGWYAKEATSIAFDALEAASPFGALSLIDLFGQWDAVHLSGLQLQMLSVMDAAIKDEAYNAATNNADSDYYLTELYRVLQLEGLRQNKDYVTKFERAWGINASDLGISNIDSYLKAIDDMIIQNVEMQNKLLLEYNENYANSNKETSTPAEGDNSATEQTDAPKLQSNGFNSEEFTKAFEQGKLELKRLDLPGTENISWISLSPKGSYLFGYQQDIGYGLYDVAQQCFTPLTIDDSGDTYGELERALRKPDYLKIVWSIDEQYFSLANYNQVAKQGRYNWDLYLGDTQSQTISVLRAWPNSIKQDDFGVVLIPCFSANGCSLYYTLLENVGNEKKYQVYEYELATGNNTLLFENPTPLWNSTEYFFSIADDRFLALSYTDNKSRPILYLIYPDASTWNSTCFELDSLPEFANVEIFSNLRLCKIDEQRFALIFQADYNMYSLLFQINESNQFEVAPDTYTQEIRTSDQAVKVVIDDTYARNIQPSPDGQYFLSVNPDESWGRRFGLWVNNTDKKYDGTPEEVKVTLPEEISNDGVFYYCIGDNSLSVAMTQGMQWGGDLVLLSPTDVCYFASAKNIPWNKTTDLTGTTWLSNAPEFAVLNFLENGIFEMTAAGETITGEYHWEAYDTIGLTAFGDTLLFVSEGDSLQFESEDGNLTFYLSK